MPVRVLFVCMGNICRSLTAEGVFKHLVAQRGLAGQVISDSAGTHDYHVGDAPDRRAQAAATQRGYDLSALRARQVTPADFHRYDHVLAMDEVNHRILQALCPQSYRSRLRLFLDFATDAAGPEVPDPYYGGEQGFVAVLDLVENAARGLLDEIQNIQLNQ